MASKAWEARGENRSSCGPHGILLQSLYGTQTASLFQGAAEVMSISSPGFHDSWEDLAQNINFTCKSFHPFSP